MKFTFKASVHVPAELTALMSARFQGPGPAQFGVRVFQFDQPVPMPAYLLTICVGKLEGKRVGPRSTVWAEPSLAEAAAWELEETEKFVAGLEKLAGPYVWGNYDILVLPSAYPYGGMEVPNCTLVSPTIIAGDRSLVDVAAHEAAHSWTGNHVTCATPGHFWLNEGNCMMLQRKVVSSIRGGDYFDFDSHAGVVALRGSVDQYGEDHEFTKLVPDLTGVDPDDAFSSVPYEKGFTLLAWLQERVGGPERFDRYLLAYYDHFGGKTLTSAEFACFFMDFFTEGRDGGEPLDLSDIDWKAWLLTPGMPPAMPAYDTTRLDQCANLAKLWVEHPERATGKELDGWASGARQCFLDNLLVEVEKLSSQEAPKAMAVATLEKLGTVYALNDTKNAEERFRWHKVALASGYFDLVDDTLEFITSVGRMKFVRPLYRALLDDAFTRQRAVDTFKQHAGFYHPICAKMVRADIAAAEGKPAKQRALLQRLPSTSEADQAPSAASDADAELNAALAETLEGMAESSTGAAVQAIDDAEAERLKAEQAAAKARAEEQLKAEQARLDAVRSKLHGYAPVDVQGKDTPTSQPFAARATGAVHRALDTPVPPRRGNLLATGLAVAGVAVLAGAAVFLVRRLTK